MSDDQDELFISEALRPDLRAFLGPVSERERPQVVLSDDPGPLLVRFSSCKESSTDGKEDTKTKEINKDDKGAAGSPTGPVRDGRGGLNNLAVDGSITRSAHSNVFA